MYIHTYPLGWLSGNRVRFSCGRLRVRGPVHTKDHHKMVQIASLLGTHELE